jgi:hypothetical protein
VTPETVGAILGSAVVSGGIVAASAKRWLSMRAERKIDAVSKELGVGIGPTIASLVMSTAQTCQRLEESMGGSGRRIEEILKVQGEHAVTLLNHEDRLVVIETRHDTCSFNKEQVAALLAQKTEDVAEVLAEKTEHVAAALAAKTVRTARTLRGGKKAK